LGIYVALRIDFFQATVAINWLFTFPNSARFLEINRNQGND